MEFSRNVGASVFFFHFFFFVCVSLALERSVRDVSHGYRWTGEVPFFYIQVWTTNRSMVEGKVIIITSSTERRNRDEKDHQSSLHEKKEWGMRRV